MPEMKSTNYTDLKNIITCLNAYTQREIFDLKKTRFLSFSSARLALTPGQQNT